MLLHAACRIQFGPADHLQWLHSQTNVASTYGSKRAGTASCGHQQTQGNFGSNHRFDSSAKAVTIELARFRHQWSQYQRSYCRLRSLVRQLMTHSMRHDAGHAGAVQRPQTGAHARMTQPAAAGPAASMCLRLGALSICSAGMPGMLQLLELIAHLPLKLGDLTMCWQSKALLPDTAASTALWLEGWREHVCSTMLRHPTAMHYAAG